ncbi:hypothetical protein [Fusobacterium sp.]|nr:hypothetical protein [Fusobacterium sp.]MDU1911227.1 hypothetical protein [Fusobacterium sp.]
MKIMVIIILNCFKNIIKYAIIVIDNNKITGGETKEQPWNL